MTIANIEYELKHSNKHIYDIIRDVSRDAINAWFAYGWYALFPESKWTDSPELKSSIEIYRKMEYIFYQEYPFPYSDIDTPYALTPQPWFTGIPQQVGETIYFSKNGNITAEQPNPLFVRRDPNERLFDDRGLPLYFIDNAQANYYADRGGTVGGHTPTVSPMPPCKPPRTSRYMTPEEIREAEIENELFEAEERRKAELEAIRKEATREEALRQIASGELDVSMFISKEEYQRRVEADYQERIRKYGPLAMPTSPNNPIHFNQNQGANMYQNTNSQNNGNVNQGGNVNQNGYFPLHIPQQFWPESLRQEYYAYQQGMPVVVSTPMPQAPQAMPMNPPRIGALSMNQMQQNYIPPVVVNPQYPPSLIDNAMHGNFGGNTSSQPQVIQPQVQSQPVMQSNPQVPLHPQINGSGQGPSLNVTLPEIIKTIYFNLKSARILATDPRTGSVYLHGQFKGFEKDMDNIIMNYIDENVPAYRGLLPKYNQGYQQQMNTYQPQVSNQSGMYTPQQNHVNPQVTPFNNSNQNQAVYPTQQSYSDTLSDETLLRLDWYLLKPEEKERKQRLLDAQKASQANANTNTSPQVDIYHAGMQPVQHIPPAQTVVQTPGLPAYVNMPDVKPVPWQKVSEQVERQLFGESTGATEPVWAKEERELGIRFPDDVRKAKEEVANPDSSYWTRWNNPNTPVVDISASMGNLKDEEVDVADEIEELKDITKNAIIVAESVPTELKEENPFSKLDSFGVGYLEDNGLEWQPSDEQRYWMPWCPWDIHCSLIKTSNGNVIQKFRKVTDMNEKDHRIQHINEHITGPKITPEDILAVQKLTKAIELTPEQMKEQEKELEEEKESTRFVPEVVANEYQEKSLTSIINNIEHDYPDKAIVLVDKAYLERELISNDDHQDDLKKLRHVRTLKEVANYFRELEPSSFTNKLYRLYHELIHEVVESQVGIKGLTFDYLPDDFAEYRKVLEDYEIAATVDSALYDRLENFIIPDDIKNTIDGEHGNVKYVNAFKTKVGVAYVDTPSNLLTGGVPGNDFVLGAEINPVLYKAVDKLLTKEQHTAYVACGDGVVFKVFRRAFAKDRIVFKQVVII